MRRSRKVKNSSPKAKKTKGRIVPGIHSVTEVLKVRPHEVTELFVKSKSQFDSLDQVVGLAKKAGIKVTLLSDKELDRMANQSQGVIAVVNLPKKYELDDLDIKAPVLVADGVEDPHNFGAMIRTAWLMGISQFIIPENRSVGLTSVVHKVACGGVEHIKLIKVGSLAQAIRQLKQDYQYPVVGMSHVGSESIWTTHLNRKICIVLGSEEKGIRSTVLNECDLKINIPQLSSEASYNVSVATGIILAEWRRQNS